MGAQWPSLRAARIGPGALLGSYAFVAGSLTTGVVAASTAKKERVCMVTPENANPRLARSMRDQRVGLFTIVKLDAKHPTVILI